MLQRAIGSPGAEVRTGILVGSCCVSGDGWSHPTLTMKLCPQKVWIASPFSSIAGSGCLIQSALLPLKVMVWSLPNHSSAGVWNKPFPFQTSIISSTAGEFWKFRSLFWKKQNGKGRKEGKRTRVGGKEKEKEENRGRGRERERERKKESTKKATFVLCYIKFKTSCW